MELLKAAAPDFHAYLSEGHRVVRLRAGIQAHPTLVRAIIASANHDVGVGETEAQVLIAAAGAVATSARASNPPFEPLEVLKSVVEDLKVRFPHMPHHCESMASFVSKFAQSDDAPFVKDLALFHSEHVDWNSKTEARFWEVLASLPADYGWAVVAFAKDNWASDKVEGGICKGVSMGVLGGMRSKPLVLRSLHDTLAAWRISRAPWLASLPDKVGARVRAKLDIVASRVSLRPSTQTPHPQNIKVLLTASSLGHATMIADVELAVACGARNTGGVAPPPPFLDLPCLDALKSDEKNKKAATGPTKREAFRPDYDASGELVNRRSAFESRGYKVGTKVAALCEVKGFEGDKEVVVSKNSIGTVIAVDDSRITVKLHKAGVVMWKWESFPVEGVAVQETSKEAGDVVNLSNPEAWSLTATTGHDVALTKARMICAIQALRVHLGKSPKVVSAYGPEGRGDVVPLRVQMRPRKGVFATAPIESALPLALLPETTNFTLVEMDDRVFLKTKVLVNNKVLVLGSVFVDPVTSKDGKGVVVHFWLVRRAEEKGQCNMEIVDSTVFTGTGCTWPRGTLTTLPMGDTVVPLMMSTKKVKAGEELVCYYKEQQPALKKVRVC